MTGSHEVSGSIPLISTRKTTTEVVVFLFCFFETEVVSALKKLRSAHQLRQKFHEL